TSIDPIEQSRGNDELMMSMSMPIDSYQPNSANTFLKINVSQAYFFKPLERLHLGETGQFFLIDRYGQMLLTEQQQYLKPYQVDYFEQISATTSSEGKLYLTSKKNGERDMVVYYKLPKTKWIIVG